MNDIIKAIEDAQLKSEVADFRVGDTVKVYAKVIEGSRERIQVFEGNQSTGPDDQSHLIRRQYISSIPFIASR